MCLQTHASLGLSWRYHPGLIDGGFTGLITFPLAALNTFLSWLWCLHSDLA